MLEVLLAPLQYPFMQRGLLAAVMVGILCSVVGTYVVVRGMAFIGDALAHAVLPGIAVAYLLNQNLLAGALVAGMLTVLTIGALSRRAQIKEDTAIGILFAGALALGVLLMSTIRSYTVDLTHILFGNVLGVSTGDLWLTGVLGVGVLLVILLLYKEFLLISFDPSMAAALRLPTDLLQYLLLILLALTIVVSLHTVGVALVVAMLVTPGATAYLLTRRLAWMMGLASLIGAASGVAGLYASYYANVASGAAIVLFCTGCFLVVLLFSPRRGIVVNWLRRRSAR